MPSSTERQRRFFGAVMSAKKGGKGSLAVKKAAKSMSKGQIEDFLKVKKENTMKTQKERLKEIIKSMISEIQKDTLTEGRKRKKKKVVEEEDQQVAPPAPVDVPEVKPDVPAAPTAEQPAEQPAPDTSGAPKADKQKAYKYLLGAMKAMIKNGTITGVSEEEITSYAQSLYKTLNKSIQGAGLEKLGAGEEAPAEEPEVPTEPEQPAPEEKPAAPAPETPPAAPEQPAPEQKPAAPAPEEPAAKPEAPPAEQPAPEEKPKAKPAPKATEKQPTNMAPKEPESEENNQQLKEAIRKIVEAEIEEYRTKGALGMKNRPAPSTTSNKRDMIFALKKLSSYAPVDRLDDLRALLDIDPIPYVAMSDETDVLFKSIQEKLAEIEKSNNPEDDRLLAKAFDLMTQRGWLKEWKSPLKRKLMKEEGGEYKPQPDKHTFVVVLNDDETFTDAEGCVIAELDNDALESMQNDTHLSDVNAFRKWGISIVNGVPKLTLLTR